MNVSQSLFVVFLVLQTVVGLNILVAGGTGRLGKILISQLLETQRVTPSTDAVADAQSFKHTGSEDGAPWSSKQAATVTSVTILTRNSYLASTPARVSEDYGHFGKGLIEKYKPTKKLTLRDWDGGDFLDIVGQDWMGWQADVLPQADVIVHLTGGGFTEQRVMACERLVRESLKYNPMAHHITVNPSEALLAAMSPGLKSVKTSRIERCEAMVRENCTNFSCLRIEQRDLNIACQRMLDTLSDITILHKESLQ